MIKFTPNTANFKPEEKSMALLDFFLYFFLNYDYNLKPENLDNQA